MTGFTLTLTVNGQLDGVYRYATLDEALVAVDKCRASSARGSARWIEEIRPWASSDAQLSACPDELLRGRWSSVRPDSVISYDLAREEEAETMTYTEMTPRGEATVSDDGSFRTYKPERVEDGQGGHVVMQLCESWEDGRWEQFYSMADEQAAR